MKLLNKPWFLVLLAGILFGGTWLWVFGPKLPDSADDQVIVTNEDLDFLAATWEKTWQRPPTAKELSSAVENYVREEILYREALKRNFDENNAVVKRSLVMQMNMLAEGQGNNDAMDEENLRAYYELRKDQYLRPARISFAHVYYNPAKRENTLDATINQDLLSLAGSEKDPSDFGDPIMLDHSFQNLEPIQVARNFGETFTEEIFTLPAGEWIGPITSAYGVHLVYITAMEAPSPAAFEEVKNEVMREMEFEEKEAAKEQFYTELIRQYKVLYQGEVKDLMERE